MKPGKKEKRIGVPKTLQKIAEDIKKEITGKDRGLWRGDWQGDTYPRYYKIGDMQKT